MPSAETSVGETSPSTVTSIPPTAMIGVVLDERAERGGGGGVGPQRGERRGGQCGRLEQGLGQAGPSRFLEDADQVDLAQPEAHGGVGHDQRRRAQLGQDGPAVGGQLGPAGLVGHLEGAQRRPARTPCRAPCARRRAARLAAR